MSAQDCCNQNCRQGRDCPQRDAARLEKLLQLCTEAKTKFGPNNEIRSVTMTFKTSAETSVGFRDKLRSLVDEITPTYSTGTTS